MPEVLPRNVINGSALVVKLLLWGLCFHVLGDLRAVGLRRNTGLEVRLVAYPSRPSASKEAVVNGLGHGVAVVGIMLGLELKPTFEDQRRDSAYGILVPESA